MVLQSSLLVSSHWIRLGFCHDRVREVSFQSSLLTLSHRIATWYYTSTKLIVFLFSLLVLSHWILNQVRVDGAGFADRQFQSSLLSQSHWIISISVPYSGCYAEVVVFSSFQESLNRRCCCATCLRRDQSLRVAVLSSAFESLNFHCRSTHGTGWLCCRFLFTLWVIELQNSMMVGYIHGVMAFCFLFFFRVIESKREKVERVEGHCWVSVFSSF